MNFHSLVREQMCEQIIVLSMIETYATYVGGQEKRMIDSPKRFREGFPKEENLRWVS